MCWSNLVALLMVCSSAFACFAQGSSAPNTSRVNCVFSEVYRAEAWTIPGLQGANPKTARARFADLPGVFVTGLRPAESETTITLVWCSRDHEGRIEIEEQPIDVLDLWKFDYDGRVFAYALWYGKEAIQGKTRVKLGAASGAVFYDMDGSGRFTVMRGATHPFPSPIVPDWAKKGPDKNAQFPK